MKSQKVSVEEMARRTARFADLKPYQTTQQQAAGVPSAVLEKIAARLVFPLMVPEGYKGRNAQAPIKGAPRVFIFLITRAASSAERKVMVTNSCGSLVWSMTSTAGT